MRIGVDVGGTNTDAVLMDGASVVAHAQDADDGERELRDRLGARARARERRLSARPGHAR